MKFTKRQLTTMVVAGLMGTAFVGASFAADASSSAADLLAMNQDRTAAPDTEKIKTLEAQIAKVQQEIAEANTWWEKNDGEYYKDNFPDGIDTSGAAPDFIAMYHKYEPIHDKGPDHLKQLQAALEAAKNGGTVPVAPQPGDEGTPSGSGETAPSPADMKRSLSLAQKNVQHLQELTARVNRDVTEAEAAAKADPTDETAKVRAESSKAYAGIVQKAMEAAKQAVTKWQQQLKVEVKDESKPFTMPSPAVETGTDIGQLQQELADLKKQLPDVEKHANWSTAEFNNNGGYANNGASTEVLLRYLQDTQKLSDLQAAIKAKEARISALSSGTGSTPGTGKEETKPHTGEPGSKPVPQPPESKVEPVQPGGGTSQGTVTPETVTQWAKLKAEAEAAEQYYNSEVWAKTYFEGLKKKDPSETRWEKEVAHADGYIANAKAEMEAKKKALESYAKEKGITADPRTKEAQAAALKRKMAALQAVKKNAANIFEEMKSAYAYGHFDTVDDAKKGNKLDKRQAYVVALQRKESNVLDTQLQQAEAALKTLDPSGTVTPPPAPPEVKPPSGKTPGVQQSEAEKKYEAAVETWTKAEAARKEKPQDETVRQQAEKAKQEVEAAKTTYLQELTAKETELKDLYDKAQTKYDEENTDEDGPDQTTIDARDKAKAAYEAIEAKIKQVKGASSSPSETKPTPPPQPPVPTPSVDPAIPKPDPEADKKKSAEELKKEIAALEEQLKQAQKVADTAEEAYNPDDQTPEGQKKLQAYEEAHKKVMQIGDVLHAKKAILKEKESSSQPQPPAPKPPKPKVDPGQSGSEPGGKTDPQPPESKVDPVQPGGGTSQGTVTPEAVTQWEKLKAEAEAAEQYYNSEVWAKTYFEEMDKKDPYQNWEKEKAHVDGYIANAKAVMEAKQKALESYAKEKGITADPRTKEAQEAALKKKIAELKEAKQNAANFDEKNDAYAKDLGHWWTFEDAKQKNKLAERQAYVEALQRKEAGVLDTQLQQAEDALKALNSSGTVTPPPAPNPPKPKVDPGQPGSEPGSKPAPQPPQPKVDPAQPGSEPGGKTDPQPSAQERQQAEADYKTYINTDEPSLKTLVAWEEEETAQAKEQAEKAGASAEDKQYYEYAKQFQERARQQLAAKQKAIGELKAKYGFKDVQPVVPPAEKKKEYTGDNDTKLSAMQKDLEALRATAQQQQQALQKNGTSYGTVGAVLTTAPDKVDMNLRRQYLQAKQTAKTAQQQYKALLADTNTLRKAMHKEELVENLAQPIFTADGQVNPSVLKGSSSGQPVPTPAENAQVQANSRRIADNTAKIAALDKRVTQVAQDVKKVGARAAALAGLRPVDDGTAKFSLAAATGGYKGENAVAMGLFYRPNKDVLISAGSTIGGDTAYNVGISFKVGTAVVHEKMGTSTPTVQEFYTVVETLQRHIAALEYKVRQMENRQTPERHR
ncbi:YadA-like family protein [uncultured Megasphaera sp.]|uniref:YadA-like family protein n=1 Tax=uncultured Megasphaera sp. TaxID=165188 RepID=UPI00259A54FC|nr:YadA-like family protein [uncultured Megasphaera sp.]